MPCIPGSVSLIIANDEGLESTYWHVAAQLVAKRNALHGLKNLIRQLRKRLNIAERNAAVATYTTSASPSEDTIRAAKIFAKDVAETREEMDAASLSHRALFLEISDIKAHQDVLRTAIRNGHF